jgi:phosphomannomutase
MTREPGELLEAARLWIAGDPEPDLREELEALCRARNFAELARRMAPLEFGTAGLRAPLGAGSGYMNRAVVLKTTYGIGRYVLEAGDGARAPVVIGYDARRRSREFAEVCAGVLLAMQIDVQLFPQPVPTPLVAFAARELASPLAIVITASHNPRGDNGYKVYGPNAAQLVAPLDRELTRRIAAAPAAREVPCLELDPGSAAVQKHFAWVAPAQYDAYFAALAAALPAGQAARDLSIVYSAFHGVGWRYAERALREAGFCDLRPVAEQIEPDGAFPTIAFPNPEEPSTLDRALSLARSTGAELVLVNDPDADRLAAAARSGGELAVLDGNQIGALLADYLLERAPREPLPLVVSSIVSSPLVAAIAESYGARYERTHTGFKWMWLAALELVRSEGVQFCFAYEEALGYSVFAGVRDKDGIAAARALAELAAAQREKGRTLFDRLFELYAAHGVWASAARPLALDPARAGAELSARLDALVRAPPSQLAGIELARVIDYRAQTGRQLAWLAPAPLLELELLDGSKAFVRPSGTEPKLKLYSHVKRDLAIDRDAALRGARDFAERLLEVLAKHFA